MSVRPGSWARRLATAVLAGAALALGQALVSGHGAEAQTQAQAPTAQPAPAKPRQKDPGERPEHYPAGANRDDAFYGCTACHGFKIVAQQGMSRERWDDSISLMIDKHAMPKIDPKERERILDYLSAAFPERRAPGGWKNPFAPN